MEDNIDLFDTSEYPEGHFLQSDKHKKALFKMKDENAGEIVDEFVGLRPKMYSMKIIGEKITYKQTAKGVSRVIMKNNITHTDYVECLQGIRPKQHGKASRIASKDHRIATYMVNKVTLCPFDDKRYWEDGVNSIAHGHRDIKSKQTC